MTLPENGIPLTRHTRIYQIRRVEDQRVRYRLRLGPFLSETQANAVLGIVREGYPAAFSATANTEDLDAFADIQFDTITAPPAAKPAAASNSGGAANPTAMAASPQSKSAAGTPLKPNAAKIELRPGNPVAMAAPAASVPPIAASRSPAALAKPTPPLLQAAAPQSAGAPPAPIKSVPTAQPRAASNATSTAPVVPPTVVDARLQRPPTSAQATSPARAAVPPPPKPATATSKSPPPAVSAAGSGTLAHQVSSFLTSMILELEPDDKPRGGADKIADAPHRQASVPRREPDEPAAVDLESTQTMRALTTAELEDHNQLSHWFAIELSVSDRPFDPDSVPDLDIFSAYRLYVLESKSQGRAVHTLRLGFFGEEIAARAVADYLADHYEKPSVMRVSIAERERFSERRVEARKKVEATGKHMAIEITDQRYVRELSVIPR